MAIYRLEAKIIGREKRDRSVVAAAAYRAGTKLYDELKEKVHDYARRLKGVVNSTVLAPEDAPDFVRNPERLWNTVEHGEKRKDAQLAREFLLAVPKELNKDAQFQLAVEWAKKELVAAGMVAEVSLHHPKDGKNPHVHILCTMRRLDGDKFASKKAIEWNDVGLLQHQRESWAEAVNEALEKAGRSERVDHRSLAAQGIDRLPEPKIGIEATAMKRRGVVADPERFKLVRRIKMLNELRPLMRSLCQRGEMPTWATWATTPTWIQKSSVVISQITERAREMMKGTWEKLVGSRSPERTGPDMER
jgi:ATP-dependent exoDNAse (exonuclease V) alpha subunit